MESCLTLSSTEVQPPLYILADTEGFQHLHVVIHGRNIRPEQKPGKCDVVPLVVFTQNEQQGMMGQGRCSHGVWYHCYLLLRMSRLE